jgi:predicted aspartyl protease
MIDHMGIFRTDLEIASVTQQDNRLRIANVMVDTGSEYNWFPEEMLASLCIVPVRVDRFETADGRIIERPIGWAAIYAGGRSTVAVVVFAKSGEMSLLGAHGLEGMNLRIDLVRRELIPAGPVPVASLSYARTPQNGEYSGGVTPLSRR